MRRGLLLLLLALGCANPCPGGIDWAVKPLVDNPGGRVKFKCRPTARAKDELKELDRCDRMEAIYHIDLCWKERKRAAR